MVLLIAHPCRQRISIDKGWLILAKRRVADGYFGTKHRGMVEDEERVSWRRSEASSTIGEGAPLESSRAYHGREQKVQPITQFPSPTTTYPVTAEVCPSGDCYAD